MQSRLSKLLEGLLARTAFDAAKHPPICHPADHLLLALIREEGATAHRILTQELGSNAREQLVRQVERTTHHRALTADTEPEKFYASLHSCLEGRFPQELRIDSAHLLLWLLEQPVTASTPFFHAEGLTPEWLNRRLHSPEEPLQSSASKGREAALPMVANAPDMKINRYACDLTQEARSGRIDPVAGRDKEIEQMIRILQRRRKNNPILVGEAGVGKSALVEGLALRIAAGEVPERLKGKRLYSLDVGALVAGTKFRGEFEERLQELLEELRQDQQSLLFIDEIHTITGAGATQGSLDLANLLKPLLARGEMQTIGATTPDEYRRHIETDAALVRRFRKVAVEPTSEAQTLEILHRLAPHYGAHHGVEYSPEALEHSIRLAGRYLTDRHFPDKAIDLMDEAGAHTAHTGRSRVTAREIEAVVTLLTGIPTERLSAREGSELLGLEKRLLQRVIGQSGAVSTLARAIRRARAGLRDRGRPMGVFLFAGPTGVGKTLLAKELSRELFATGRSLIRLDMGEYKERHSLSRLIGSPPGYIGYGEGGELTEAVRRNPYSVILFDEIEKAHKELFHLLLPLLDEGILTDAAGRRVDFRNTVIIMTSNLAGSSPAKPQRQIGYGVRPRQDHPQEDEELQRALEECFPQEFLGRVDEVIRFRELDTKALVRIIEQELALLSRRTEELGYRLRITPKARLRLADRGRESRYGARSLRRTLQRAIEEPLSGLILGGKIRPGGEVIVEPDREGPGVKLRVA